MLSDPAMRSRTGANSKGGNNSQGKGAGSTDSVDAGDNLTPKGKRSFLRVALDPAQYASDVESGLVSNGLVDAT